MRSLPAGRTACPSRVRFIDYRFGSSTEGREIYDEIYKDTHDG